MKLYFMKSTSLGVLKAELPNVYTKYFTEADGAWLMDICGEDPFEDAGIEVPDFELASLDDGASAGRIDLENCKIIYRNLKVLNETQASDERLWAGMTHGMFYSYMRRRWGYDWRAPQDAQKDVSEILTRFFFQGGVRSGFYRNTFAKCWWVGKALCSEDRKNPFHMLDVLGASNLSSKINDIFYNNTFSSNPEIVKGVLFGVEYFAKQGNPLVVQKHIRPAMSALNALGGRVILDCLSAEEIKENFIETVEKLLQGKGTAAFGTADAADAGDDAAEADDSEVVIEPVERCIVEGNTVDLQALDGTRKRSFQIKMRDGKMPTVAASLLGKKLHDELSIDGQVYVVIGIK